jgi:hypothetical protein
MEKRSASRTHGLENGMTRSARRGRRDCPHCGYHHRFRDLPRFARTWNCPRCAGPLRFSQRHAIIASALGGACMGVAIGYAFDHPSYGWFAVPAALVVWIVLFNNLIAVTGNGVRYDVRDVG